MKRLLVLWVLLGWLVGCAESLPSQNRWVELEIGMTPEQVREVVGSPKSIVDNLWFFGDAQKDLVLWFKNGVLIGIYR